MTLLHPHLAALIQAPLTEAQTGLWYAQRMDLNNPIFNTGQYAELRGPLNLDAFRRAVDTTMTEADGLAVRVIDTPEAPLQVVDPALRPVLQVIDLRGEAEPRTAALARMRADMHGPVNTGVGPMASQRLFVLGADHHLWYQRVHHVATDGYGMALIDSRVAQLYAAYSGASQDAGQPFGAFQTVLDEDAEYRASALRERDRAFWLNAFAQPAPVANLAEGTPVSGHRFLHASTALPEALAAAMRTLESATEVSWPDILVALTAAYLCRHSGQRTTVVGVPWMGRLGSVSARVPAMVMNIVPLQVTVDEDAPIGDFLVETSKAMRRARRHGRYRSEQLRRDLGLLGGRKRLYGPLVNVLPFDDAWGLAGLDAQRHILGTGPVDDLSVTFRADNTGHGLRLAIDANPALYSQDDVAAHLARLEHFLAKALAAASLAHVPTLTPAEAHRWLVDVNDTAHPVEATTLSALIVEAMRAHPKADALVYGPNILSYAELDARTAALAQRLRDQGVQRGDIVAVAIPRSIELVLALVAILRAGAAYLPLDLNHPRERLATILRSAAPRLVLSMNRLRALLPEDANPLCLNSCEADSLHADQPLPSAAGLAIDPPRPDDAAYVIYTSGSTGTPKGVVVEHDAIVNRLQWMRSNYSVGPSDRILQKTPATFDVSVWEFFLPLIVGGTLVMAPAEAHKDPAWLAAIVRTHAITTLHFVPSMLAAFLAEPSAAGLTPRLVFCSGEELPAALRDRFHAVMQGELHNLYGPTEAAVDVSWWPASADDRSQPVPIGFPVWNTALYVLDERLRPVPAGVPGHLYLAGRQLARGYLGQPGLTDERFVPNPFQPGKRMYATGDLARWREDGALVFLGRSDHQVKIRGQRIELGEIESVVAADPAVAHVAVIVRTDRPGDQHIVAYVVAKDGATLDLDVLRNHAAARLPDYMLPSAFMPLAALPVTANGKLDRNALPAPAFAARVGRAAAAGSEQIVAGLFAKVLGREDRIGADDDFFELGGHSLLAARLALAIREHWGQALGLGAVFAHPTVARLAAYLDAREASAHDPAGAEGFGPVITLRHGDPARAPLFCVHPAGGLSWCYGNLARAMDPARTVYGLQALALNPDNAESPASLDEMAATYVDTVLALQPAGPYHLAGWSVGGILAQAMAVDLQKRGHEVGTLALLDAYPSDVWRDQPEPPEDAVYKALLLIAGHDPSALHQVALTRDGVIGFLRASGHVLGELSDDMLDGVFRVVAGNNRLVRLQHHQRFAGQMLYFRAALDHVGLDLSPQQWAPYADAIEVFQVPSLHAHLTGPEATAYIAPVLNAHLLAADRARQGH
jgi:enterobactin synthetase component F